MKHFASLLANKFTEKKKLSNFLPIDFALPCIICNHFRCMLLNFMHVYMLTNMKPVLKTFMHYLFI